MLRPVQTVVVGSGAVGGVIAAHLIRAGNEVLLCDRDQDHVVALNADGLQIVGPVEQLRVPARAVLPDGLPDSIDRALVAVKSHHTRAAAELLRDRLSPDGYVVSLQNGLTLDVLVEVLGRERVVGGFVDFGADLVAPGVVAQGNVAAVRVGELDGRLSTRLAEVVALLPWAEPTTNIAGYRWSKQAYGAMLFATAVTDLTIADALAEPRYRPLMVALAREVLDRAPVRCEAFDGFEPTDVEGSLDALVALNRASGKARTGVWRDLAVHRRPTEVDDLDAVGGPLVHLLVALVRAIERDERRCEVANLELMVAYERLDRLGRPLNAVVEVLPAPHRAAEGPLLGVAVAVKDMIDIEGVVRGNGNPRAMAGSPAVADAPVVARLRAAGADVFATAALLEYAAGAQHPGLAEARNPADPGRTAGGSSGGSAALVAAGVCPAALGTDTGGSIRIPASYCGCVGYKGSYGLVPVDGVTALAPSLDHVGVLAADVATAAAVMGVIGGVRPAAVPSVSVLRIGVLVDELDDPRVEPAVRAAVQAALDRLVGAGARLVRVDVGPLRALHATFEPVLLFEAWRELGSLTADPTWFGPDTARLLRLGAEVERSAYEAALAQRQALLPAADALLDEVDVLLGPAVAFVAPATTPVIDSPEGEVEGLFSMAANLTGAPAVVLPCGDDGHGLPVGLQLMGRRGGDADLLAVAGAVERVLRTESGER